jgi:Holliday junction resolvase-like predicted endonuclease
LKKSDKSEVKLDSWAAECLFGSIYLVSHLCEGEKQLAFYRQFYDEPKAKQLPITFFEGFKLALIALLHRIVIQVIETPESIGIRRSEKIDWTYLFGLSETRSIHKLPNLSAQGILITNLLSFRKKILESKDWNILRAETEGFRDYLHSFQEIFLSCYIGRLDKSDDVLNPESALKTKLPELILIFLNDENNLRIAFKEMYRLNPPTMQLEQHKRPLERKETQIDTDPLQMFRHSRRSFMETTDRARIFLRGFKFANMSLWQVALGETEFAKFGDIFDVISKCSSWGQFSEAFDKLNDSIVSEFEKSNRTNETDLVLTKKVPNALSHKLIVPLEKPTAVQTQLADVLNHRPAKVIGFEGSNGASQFCTVLLGLVYQHKLGFMHEKVEVIEFVHKQKTRGNDYSYALFIPTSSDIADYSRWWVFYRCATDHSGYGGASFARIHSYLEGLKPFIHCKRFATNEESFFEYFKSDYVRFIERECRKATEENSLLRGAFLELLVAAIFVKRGFKILLRHRSKLLGRKEIDVIAMKHDCETNFIYIVECKERSLTADAGEFHRISNTIFEKLRAKGKGPFAVSESDAMFKVIEDFENEKLKPLRANLQQFAEEINHVYNDDMRLIGVVATTELFEAPLQITPNTELWTYWTLKKKLQEVKIDKSFIEIIENHLAGTVGRPIADLDFYKDYFD